MPNLYSYTMSCPSCQLASAKSGGNETWPGLGIKFRCPGLARYPERTHILYSFMLKSPELVYEHYLIVRLSSHSQPYHQTYTTFTVYPKIKVSVNPIYISKMVKVAVAGGTGGVGFAIVDALKEQSEHEFILLSRTVRTLRSLHRTHNNMASRQMRHLQQRTVFKLCKSTTLTLQL